MNIAIDIRPLMNKQRTGVGEYAFELLDAVFLNTNTEDTEKKGNTENIEINQYFLFYNSYKDVSVNIPKWNSDNVHYVVTRWPNKLLSLALWLGAVKLDRLILRHLERNSTERRVKSKDPLHKEWDPSTPSSLRSDFAQDDVKSLDYFFAPNINFLSLSKKTKFILTVHDLSFKILPECFPLKWRLVYKIINPRNQCRRADIILTPSENTKRDLVLEWGIDIEKVKVVRPGLSSIIRKQISDNSESRSEDVKRKYNLPEKYILYLGTIEPRKNILGIIEAYKKSSLLVDGCSLIIAGASGWKNEEIFKTIENTAGVKYIGYVDNEDKTGLYKNASLFVFPSLYEGFGLPVLEALACGVPVITSNRSSLSEVFGDYVTLVNSNNINEIGVMMREVLDKKNVNAIFDLDEFNWEKTASNFLRILH